MDNKTDTLDQVKEAWTTPEVVDLSSAIDSVESTPGPSPDFGGVSGS